MTDEPLINFERGSGADHEHVCATIYLPLGMTLTLWSDEVKGCRDWDLDEVELHPGDGETRPAINLMQRWGKNARISESELISFVRREWDREVAREAKQAAGAQEVLDVHV